MHSHFAFTLTLLALASTFGCGGATTASAPPPSTSPPSGWRLVGTSDVQFEVPDYFETNGPATGAQLVARAAGAQSVQFRAFWTLPDPAAFVSTLLDGFESQASARTRFDGVQEQHGERVARGQALVAIANADAVVNAHVFIVLRVTPQASFLVTCTGPASMARDLGGICNHAASTARVVPGHDAAVSQERFMDGTVGTVRPPTP